MQPNHYRDKTDTDISLYNDDYQGFEYQDDDADLETDVHRSDNGRQFTTYRTDTFARLESEPSQNVYDEPSQNGYEEPSQNGYEEPQHGYEEPQHGHEEPYSNHQHYRQSVSELGSEEQKSDGEHIVDFENYYEEEEEHENPEDLDFNGYEEDEGMYGGNQFDEQGLMNQVYDNIESDVSVPLEMTGPPPVYQAMANFQTLESQSPDQNGGRKSHTKIENICYYRRDTMDLDQDLELDPEQDYTSPNGPPPQPAHLPWNQNKRKRHPKEHRNHHYSDTYDDIAHIPSISQDFNPQLSRFMKLEDSHHDQEILNYHKRGPVDPDASSPQSATQRSDPTESRVVGRRGLPSLREKLKRHSRMQSYPPRTPTTPPQLDKFLSVPLKDNKKNPKDKVESAGSPPNRSSTKSSKSNKTAKIRRELNMSRSLHSRKSVTSVKSFGTLKEEPVVNEIKVNMNSVKKGNLGNITDLDDVWTKAHEARHKRKTSKIIFPDKKRKHRKNGSDHLDALPNFRREDEWMKDDDHTEMISEYEPSDMAEMKKMQVKGFTPSKIKPLNAVKKKHVVETIKRDDGTGHRLGKYHPVITQPFEHNDKSVIFMRESLKAFGLFLAFPWCLLFLGYIPCSCCQRQFRIWCGAAVIFNCYVLTAAHHYLFETFELWYIMPWVYGILFFAFMIAPYFKMRESSRTQLAYVFSLYVEQVHPSTSYWLIPLFCSMCAILAYGFGTIILEEEGTFFIKCGSMFGFASLVYGTAFTITKWIAITDEKMLLRVEPSPLRASEIQNVLDKQLKDYDADMKNFRSDLKFLHKQLDKHNFRIERNNFLLDDQQKDVETHRKALEELRTQMEPLLNGSMEEKRVDHRPHSSQTYSRQQWERSSSTEDDGPSDFTPEAHDEFRIRRDRNENGSFVIDPDDNNFEINAKDDGFEWIDLSTGDFEVKQLKASTTF